MAFLPSLLNMFKGKAGGSQMKPLQDLQKEELDNWGGYDSGNEKSKMTQYANAYNGQNDEQNTAMFGQGGDVKKQMGTIWDQIKSGAGKFGDDLKSNYEKNMREAGYMESEPEKNPYENPETSSSVNETQTSEDLFKNTEKRPETPDQIKARESIGGQTLEEIQSMDGYEQQEDGNFSKKGSDFMFSFDPKTNSYIQKRNNRGSGGLLSQTPLGPGTAAVDGLFSAFGSTYNPITANQEVEQ
tara:strand:+ start:369 stop:1094 length:726 start_codon:yes stop_codon:yes gene_type:complete